MLALGGRDDYVALWNRIRALGPVLDAGDGVFVVTDWECANAALRSPALRAGSGVSAAFGMESPVESVVRNWLMSLDGDEHRRARGLVSRLFSPRAVADLEPCIRDTVRKLVDTFLDHATAHVGDFMAMVAARLPSEVARLLFAVDPEEWRELVEPLFLGDKVSTQDGFAAVQGLTPYFHQKISKSAGLQTGGLIDQLREADRMGSSLSEAEVIANAVLIVTAAIDTTAGLIGNTLLALLENPDSLAQLRRDRSAIAAAVDESLRYYPSAPSTTRHAATDLTLGGVLVPAGSDLFCSITAANRDPKKFADPDRFDIARENAAASLTFGGGPHMCLGASLARLEARLVFDALLQSDRTLELDEPVRWRTNNPVVRAPERLMISAGG